MDIAIYLMQYQEGPLSKETVGSVEYYLGPIFSDRPYIKSDYKNGFQLDVSAYGPMLYIAKVNLIDGSKPFYLERYIDFPESLK